MYVHLFGSIEIDLGMLRMDARSFGGRKPKQVFELMLLQRGRPVSAEQLASTLWPDDSLVAGIATVQHYVSVLRRRLDRLRPGGSVFVSSRWGYELDPDAFSLDLDRFDAVVAQAGAALPALQRPLFGRALDMIRGDVLADEVDAPWAVDVRTRYRRAHAQLLVQACAAALRMNDPVAALELARTAVVREPYAEPSACMLMAAAYAAGDVAASLRAYAACRRGLVEALGVDPLPHTVSMRDAIERRAPVADLVAAAVRVASTQSAGAARRRCVLVCGSDENYVRPE